jgi:hypothetical protein
MIRFLMCVVLLTFSTFCFAGSTRIQRLPQNGLKKWAVHQKVWKKVQNQSSEKSELPLACRTRCVTPYGFELGITSGGVSVYSNCKYEGCISGRISTLNKSLGISDQDLEWSSMEFVKRWLFINKSVTFDFAQARERADDTAMTEIYDTWFQVKQVQNHHPVTKDQFPTYPILNFTNGDSKIRPHSGDILFYGYVTRESQLNGFVKRTGTPYGDGHVAIITEVDPYRYVRIVEQNFYNKDWQGRDYSRQLPLKLNDDGTYSIGSKYERPYIMGWKRIKTERRNHVLHRAAPSPRLHRK